MEGTGTVTRRTVYAVLITDVYKFTQITGDNEEAVINRVSEDLTEFRHLCETHGGRVVTDRGDGLKMVFESPVEALKAALEMQGYARDRTMKEGRAGVVRHRMGLHFGDVMLVDSPMGDEDKVTGIAVTVAARLEEECTPGQIYYSNEVYEFTKSVMDLPRRYVGPLEVKNLKERVRTWSTGYDDPDLPKPKHFTPQEERLVRQTMTHARREFEYEHRARLKVLVITFVCMIVICAAVAFTWYRVNQIAGPEPEQPTITKLEDVTKTKTEIKNAGEKTVPQADPKPDRPSKNTADKDPTITQDPPPDYGSSGAPGATTGTQDSGDSGTVEPTGGDQEMVPVDVCSKSGMCAGVDCKKTETKKFPKGQQPTRSCDQCANL